MQQPTGGHSIPEPELLSALQVLRRGGIIAYPTETFYGLGADATRRSAVRRIFAIKVRERGKPLSVLVANRQMLDLIVRSVPPAAERLMERYWPGALTIVLEAAPSVLEEVTGATGKIGVRISPHPVAARLVRELGRPLIATSANRSGSASPATAREVARELGADVEVVLDAGRLPGKRGSTVVDATVIPPRVIRFGDLPVDLNL